MVWVINQNEISPIKLNLNTTLLTVGCLKTFIGNKKIVPIRGIIQNVQ